MWASGKWEIGCRSRSVRARNTADQVSERTKRIRVLNADLEILRAAAKERTRLLETKASFVVVAAGVLASAAGAQLIKVDTWLVGLVPFGLTIATIAVSTVALWPRKLDVPSGRNLVTTWVDKDAPVEELEDYLLEVKATEEERRDEQNELRAKWLKRGFRLLLLSLVTALLVAALNAFGPVLRSTNDEQQRVETPAGTQAPATP